MMLWMAALAALQSASIAPSSLRPRSIAVCQVNDGKNVDLTAVVLEQAAQIAELRKEVESMRQEQSLYSPEDADGIWRDQLDRPPVPEIVRPSKKPVYKLYGRLPRRFDSREEIESLIDRRVSARLKKHYSQADRLQKRIMRMGVRLDDRRRTWSLQKDWEKMLGNLQEEDQQSWRKQQDLQKEVEQRMRELFSYWDQNGNGLIDRGEFSLVMQVLGITGTEEVIDATFAKWDVDQSGELDFKEVRAALNALQEAGTPLELLGHEAFLDELATS